VNFAAIDFETAIKHHICAVGIVTVENGEIIEEFYSLVKPPRNEYNWYCTQVHGITSSDTKYSPIFKRIFPEIKKRLSNKIVVAHNESFDRNLLMKSMLDNALEYSELNISDTWECTMKYCRSNDKYPSGKLNECCKVEGIELNHHEALSDARACAELFLRIKSASS
jgi:DNA polymerase-3 subunit epsilon